MATAVNPKKSRFGLPSLRRLTWVDWVLNVLRVAIILAVVIGATNTIISGKYTAAQWISLVTAGLAQGSIYALFALPYTLV